MKSIDTSSITPKQKWLGVCIVAGLLIFALGFVLLIKPRMDKPGEINSEKAGVQAQVGQQTVKLQALQAKASKLPLEQRIAAKVGEKFPSTADQANLLSQIRAATAKAGLRESAISGLTLGVPVVSVGNASAGVSVPGNTQPSGASSAPSSSSASSVPGATTGTTGTTGTTPGAGGQLATMTIAMTVTGPAAKVQAFLKAMENGPRAFLVNSLTVGGGSSGSSGSGYSASVGGTMFIMPGPKSSTSPTVPTPAVTPGAPVPSSTPTH